MGYAVRPGSKEERFHPELLHSFSNWEFTPQVGNQGHLSASEASIYQIRTESSLQCGGADVDCVGHQKCDGCGLPLSQTTLLESGIFHFESKPKLNLMTNDEVWSLTGVTVVVIVESSGAC